MGLELHRSRRTCQPAPRQQPKQKSIRNILKGYAALVEFRGARGTDAAPGYPPSSSYSSSSSASSRSGAQHGAALLDRSVERSLAHRQFIPRCPRALFMVHGSVGKRAEQSSTGLSISASPHLARELSSILFPDASCLPCESSL